MNKTVKEILNIIKNFDTITIYGHINPDPDAFGSSIGLREIIRDNFPHKKVFAVGEGQERFHERLAKYDVVDDETIKNSLAIVCDSSELPRVQDQRVNLAKQIIKIDHHVESGPFYGIKWVDVNAIACSQMVAELAFEAKLKVSKLAAELLYLGICTDSGRFRYAPTNAKTHRIIANLYDLGIDPKSIFDIIYQSEESLVKYQALLVSNFKRTQNGVIYCFADVKDYQQYGLTFDQISKNVNVIGSIRGCPIWVLFTRSPEDYIRVEFRSNGINVQEVAVKYGGGGHPCAAGCRLDNQKDFKLAMKVVEDLDKVVEKHLQK